MEITLEPLQQADAKELYKFELENRDFFEKTVPSRGEDYYNWETFKIRHESLLDEQMKGQSYYYLIKNQNGLILGRINLVDIDQSLNLGYIGYRVGEAYTGKGIANNALKVLLRTMTNQDIKQIVAKTTTNNIASQKVLEKNGFKPLLTNLVESEMNETNQKFFNYLWTI